MVLQNAGPDAIVAEASAYSSRYHRDAVAAEEGVVAGLPKERFLAALADEPTLAESWSATGAQCSGCAAQVSDPIIAKGG